MNKKTSMKKTNKYCVCAKKVNIRRGQCCYNYSQNTISILTYKLNLLTDKITAMSINVIGF